MKLLADSHVLIWSATGRGDLSAKAREALSDRTNQALVSAATAYEIEFKRLRDPLIAQLPNDLNDAVIGQGFQWLPITPEHAQTAARLPRLHGDPFDRIIIAQALIERATVVTIDRWFPAYGASVLW